MNEVVYIDTMYYFERVSPGEGESNNLLYIFSNQKGRRYSWTEEGFLNFIKRLESLVKPEVIEERKTIYVRVNDAQDLRSSGMWYSHKGGEIFKVYAHTEGEYYYVLVGKYIGIKPEDCEIVDEEKSAAKNDPVHHPTHYTSGKIEVIDFIADQQLGFCLGNTVKYIARAGKKDPAKHLEDLKKAAWYLNREIQQHAITP